MTEQMRDTDRRDNAQDAQNDGDPGIAHVDLHSEGGPGEEVYRLPAEFDVHGPKRQEIDAKAARRAERQVASLFGLAAVSTLAFCVAYLAIKLGESDDNVARTQLSTILLGVFLGIALFCIGAGVIQWTKTLMAEDEYVQERHPLRSSAQERQGVVDSWHAAVDESAWIRRPVLRRSLLAAMALLPLPVVLLLGDLGPLPQRRLRETLWTEGQRILIDVSRRPVRPTDLAVGSLISAIPEAQTEIPADTPNNDYLNQLAKSAIILVRMRPEEIVSQQGENWDYEGILAYSKICTHVGCPTSLYEQQTHHLLCPCHQSTFDISDSGRVVFGPAARSMPQLAITVDSEGYLVAAQGFTEPVGPSFWERG
jgi:ubiquinol-cytochrome c reductase iron-sulfur subunit